MNRTRISRLAMVALAGGVAAATTHVVVKGDTLWDITGHYLGNPFLWPTVWKHNAQIKDAHWIYPGDTVTVVEGGAVPSTGAEQAVPPAAEPESGDNARLAPSGSDPLSGFTPGIAVAARQQVNQDTNPNIVDLVVPPKTSYLNDQIVLMAPLLVPENTSHPGFEGRIQWDEKAGRQEVMLGALLALDIGTDKGIKEGDRVLVVETGDQVATVTSKVMHGRLEQARAIAVVVEARSKSSIVRTEKVFGRITRSALVRPWANPRQTLVTKFGKSSDTRPDLVMANTRMGSSQMPGSYVMVDRGEASSVAAGDIYEFMDGSMERGIMAMRGYGMVVATTPATATVLVIGSNPKPIQPGDKAWRIRVASHG